MSTWINTINRTKCIKMKTWISKIRIKCNTNNYNKKNKNMIWKVMKWKKKKWMRIRMMNSWCKNNTCNIKCRCRINNNFRWKTTTVTKWKAKWMKSMRWRAMKTMKWCENELINRFIDHAFWIVKRRYWNFRFRLQC